MTKLNTPIKMRDGSVAQDPRLGRLASFDERSRNYSVGDIIAGKKLAGKTWYLNIWLNQAATSACTGNARTYDLAASPRPLKQTNGKPFDEAFAQALYQLAKKYDEWTGEDYEGSSVLGAAKAAQYLGFIGEYRWAFNIDDMLVALSTIGPVVVGTTWLNSMFTPLPTGELEIVPDSGDAGGHSYMFRGVTVSESAKTRIVGKGRNRSGIPLMRLRNSWYDKTPGSEPWGVNGEAFIWADDYERYLMPGGEQQITTTAFHR